MATITAISSGNWSSTNTWDLGRIPNADDDVDIQSFGITGDMNITCKSIKNTSGYVRFTGNRTINCDVYSPQGSEVFRISQNALTITFNGDIYGSFLRTDSVSYISQTHQYVYINGNINITNGFIWYGPNSGYFHYNYWHLTINGDVTLNEQSFLVNNSFAGNGAYGMWVTINGNTTLNNNSTLGTYKLYSRELHFVLNGNVYANTTLISSYSGASPSTLYISGNVTINNTLGSVCNTFTLGGWIYYKNKTKINTLLFNNSSVVYNEHFRCIYIGDEEPFGYFISQDELHNTNQYPSPSNVKKDIPYAFNQMVGTYLPDYPPETVVLKDYAYDGGEMVGTYEGGGTVQNTINVYPYKRRNH